MTRIVPIRMYHKHKLKKLQEKTIRPFKDSMTINQMMARKQNNMMIYLKLLVAILLRERRNSRSVYLMKVKSTTKTT